MGKLIFNLLLSTFLIFGFGNENQKNNPWILLFIGTVFPTIIVGKLQDQFGMLCAQKHSPYSIGREYLQIAQKIPPGTKYILVPGNGPQDVIVKIWNINHFYDFGAVCTGANYKFVKASTDI